MGNARRGIIDVIVGDAEEQKTYQLRYGANELIAVEERFELSGIAEIGNVLSENLSMKNAVALFQIGLSGAHPDLNEAAAGEIMSDFGVAEALAKISEAMEAAFPKKDDAAGAENPPKK